MLKSWLSFLPLWEWNNSLKQKKKRLLKAKWVIWLVSGAISHFSDDVRNGVLTHQLSVFLWAYSSHFWNAWFLRTVQEHPFNNRKMLRSIPVLYLYVVLVQRGVQLLPSSSVLFHTWHKSLGEISEHITPRCCRCRFCEGQKQALVTVFYNNN